VNSVLPGSRPPDRDASAPAVCSICSGRLVFTMPGRCEQYRPAVFSPSYHVVGAHGDLYRCLDCGTVHQPALPHGSELHNLYRATSDPEYLAEEQGRRRSARRLLRRLARHAPRGRLLQVGCGYGLLLDEARRRGYDVEGVELSADAARHARVELGLPIEEASIEEATLAGAPYDAILLVDVLEHLEDPIAVLRRLRPLLADRGALLIVTPDPSSLVARLAGGRWWCYVPAHHCLIPRRTLRGLVRACGLQVVDDGISVRTFSLEYWLAGLSERSGAAGAVARWAARLPGAASLTASTLDERVLIACASGDSA
jgi:SAM-dependent methyltransferase